MVLLSQMQTKPSLEELFFQQKGTPSHCAFQARDYLKQFLPESFCETVNLLLGFPYILLLQKKSKETKQEKTKLTKQLPSKIGAIGRFKTNEKRLICLAMYGF